MTGVVDDAPIRVNCVVQLSIGEGTGMQTLIYCWRDQSQKHTATCKNSLTIEYQ